MTLRFGEIVLAWIAYHQTPGGKTRPAVVLIDSGDADCVLAPITSHPWQSKFDLQRQDWREAKLNVPSTIRVHKMTVIPKSSIARSVGSLSSPDRQRLSHLLADAFRE